VSQPWGGAGFGGTNLPRIGQEVIVDFLGGDPDRPIIVGRVYTGLQKTPYKLPDNKTQSGWQSRSSPGGGGDNYNEIMFEDKKGQELVRMQAEKDLDKLVKNDESVKIGHDRTKQVAHDDALTVGNDRTRQVGHDETVSIGHDRQRTVAHDETISIGNDRTRLVGNNESVTIGNSRSKSVAVNESLFVGANQNEEIGANRSVNVGANHSEKIGANMSLNVGMAKSETVALASAETVGAAKALTVGGAYAITVGGMMATNVALMQTESVGSSKRVTVGEKLEIVCGAASIVLKIRKGRHYRHRHDNQWNSNRADCLGPGRGPWGQSTDHGRPDRPQLDEGGFDPNFARGQWPSVSRWTNHEAHKSNTVFSLRVPEPGSIRRRISGRRAQRHV
jgi:type VI secretion system secreted protein VgrG